MTAVDPAAALVEHRLRGAGSGATWTDLRATLRALTGVTRVLLVTGDWTEPDGDGVPHLEADAADVVRRLTDTTLISIAAVSGEVTGNPLRLALACTMRVAAPGTVFRVTDVVGGLVPPPDVLAALRSALGSAGALELAATARPLGVQEAAARGLALAGTPGDARDLGAAILAAPDDAVRTTVALLRTGPLGRWTAEQARSLAMLHDR